MLPEIALEALRYFDRTALEGLQMHSRYLRDLVDRHARTLPLRYVNEVELAYGGLWIQAVEEPFDASYVVEPGALDPEKHFNRFNNAFIHRLSLSFRRDEIPILRYLRANANGLQYAVKTLHIRALAVEIDDALVDFLGVHLKPRAYEASIGDELSEDYTILFKHNALRARVTHLEYGLFRSAPAPNCILPKLFGGGLVQTCAIITQVDPRPWIGKFVEMFETAKRGTDIVESVTLLYTRVEVASLSHSVEPLQRPRRTDAPVPHSRVVKEWFSEKNFDHECNIFTESTFAELYVFENVKSAKKLDVFVWTVMQKYEGQPCALNYAFLFQVLDI